MKKRFFIAIDFPRQVKKQISEVVERLGGQYPEIRWEREENIHLTLKFLGWVDTEIANSKLQIANSQSKLSQIMVGMEKAVRGIEPFWLQPTKIGYFLKESLIIWLGAEAQEGLGKLVENLEREMGKIGFPKEKREFTAHITLGRLRHAYPVGQWRQIAQEIVHFKTPVWEKFQVTQIVLMESHLTPVGSIYTLIRRVEIGKSGAG